MLGWRWVESEAVFIDLLGSETTNHLVTDASVYYGKTSVCLLPNSSEIVGRIDFISW